MDHAEARELLLAAAVEPGGLERLTAGDTGEASALAGHLAGCPDCSAEMEQLRRDATLIRTAVRLTPPPELRGRTLAFVAAVGRPRAASVSVLEPGAPPGPVHIGTGPALTTGRPGRLARLVPWAASLAAALVVAVAGTAFIVGGSRDAVIERQSDQIGALGRIATATLRIDGQPDAEHVDLAAASGLDATASLLYSRGSAELVILAEGLQAPPAGQEYRCWVEVGGERTRIGRMFFAGDVAFWVGDVPALSSSGDDMRFGVTLVEAVGDSVAGDPVLESER
jgi:hypothetical protein